MITIAGLATRVMDDFQYDICQIMKMSNSRIENC